MRKSSWIYFLSWLENSAVIYFCKYIHFLKNSLRLSDEKSVACVWIFLTKLVQKIFYSIIICNIMLSLSPRLRCPHAEHKKDRILRNTDSFGDNICYLNLLVPFNISREADFLNISLRTSGQWDVWIWAHLWIVEINL